MLALNNSQLRVTGMSFILQVFSLKLINKTELKVIPIHLEVGMNGIFSMARMNRLELVNNCGHG